jgi:hypothetical protein
MVCLIPDTNVWIGVGRNPDTSGKLERAQANGRKTVIAPAALIELVRGMVRHGNETFVEDKKTYQWMVDNKCDVLELTKPFMIEVLRADPLRNSRVLPIHYHQLIGMVTASNSLDEFIQRCNAKGSVWNKVDELDLIHEAVIEKELKALEALARQDKNLDVSGALAKTFRVCGVSPDAATVREHFSAAIEYLQSSLKKVSQGAKPRKNDRGLYVDWQLLMYLALPEALFVTDEDFSPEITKSPQKDRIVKPDSLQ